MKINSNWNILGHKWAVDLLRGQLNNNRIRHAYLITGPQGVGRRTLALRLAQAINCPEPPEAGVPCGICRACRLLEKMQHPDLAVIQAEKVGGNLKVDQIRELHRTLSLTPYETRYRIALLLRFEEANPSAANALLKTLEEPPPQVVIILTAQDSESLLPTIVSRCETLRLRPLSIPKVTAGLENQYKIPSEEAQLLAHISGGRPGYALHRHQNPQVMAGRKNSLTDLLKLLSASRVERFSYAETLAKDKSLLENILQVWASFWRDVMLISAGASPPITHLDLKAEIEILAGKLDLTKTSEMVNLLENSQRQLKRYVNTRLILEVLMLKLPRI
jgi:DNA polymerase III subunit delta'